MTDFDQAASRAIAALGRQPTRKDHAILHKAIKRELMKAFNEGYEAALARPRAPHMLNRNWPGVRHEGRFVPFLTIAIPLPPASAFKDARFVIEGGIVTRIL